MTASRSSAISRSVSNLSSLTRKEMVLFLLPMAFERRASRYLTIRQTGVCHDVAVDRASVGLGRDLVLALFLPRGLEQLTRNS